MPIDTTDKLSGEAVCRAAFDENAFYNGNPTLADMFALLGAAEHVGHAFAITRKCLVDDYKGDVQRLLVDIPKPDYEHRIVIDAITDNLIVLRPEADGSYSEHFAGYQRLR